MKNQKIINSLFQLMVIFLINIITGLFNIARVMVGDNIVERSKDLSLFLYTRYNFYLGMIFIFVAIGLIIGLIFKLDLFRKIAVALAIWTLLTSPLIGIWFTTYSSLSSKESYFDSNLSMIIWIIISTIITVLPKIYIIVMLKTDKLRCLFLKKV